MFFLILASLIWSLSFGVTGALLRDLPAVWLAAARLAIAALCFLPFVRRVPFRLGLALFANGAWQFGLMSLAYMSSFRYLKSHEVILFTATMPLYVTLTSDLAERSFSPRSLMAALLAVGGALAILWRGISSEQLLRGFLLVELANLLFATGQIAYREIMRRAPAPCADHQLCFWLYLGGFSALAIPALHSMAQGGVQALSQVQVAAVLYLGVVVSGVAYFLWNLGLRRVSGGILAVMNNLKIPLGMAASLLLFGEQVRPSALAAGSLMIMVALCLCWRAVPKEAG